MKFIDNKINLKELKNSQFDLCLLENNEKQIGQICDFFNSRKKIFLLSGFLGSGKTAIVDFVMQNLNQDVLVMKYTCCETTVVDDMLLAFFEIFKKFTIEGKIVSPKIKVENFATKINTYFNSIDKPVVIFLDSFSSLLKENKSEIFNFITHLTKFANIKIIITSRVFDFKDFDGLDCDTSSVLALSKDLFEKYLKANEIKNIGILSNELYKQSKGYYLYLSLSVKLMKLHEYNLGKFLEVFSKSMLSFADFILREALSLVDPVSLHLFRLLAVMRIPISKKLIKTFNIYNEDQVEFFLENLLLVSDGDFLYLPDYFREITERQIQDSVMIKLHRACVELYETQLPLKPLERDLRLSRQTMRNEIDYHSLFIPKKPIIIQNNEFEKLPQVPETKTEEPPKIETKEEKIKKINFIVEDETMLDNIADSIKDFVNYEEERKEFLNTTNTLSLTQLLNSARKHESNYNYKSAIILYQTALTKKDDANYDTFLPVIYTKLASVYKKTSQWYEALEYFTKAQDWYYNVSDNIKVCEMKFEISNIYFETYKHKNAQYILTELDKNKDITNELRVKVNLALGKLSQNLKQEYNYYKQAVLLADNQTDKSVIMELYYRYACVCDDFGNTKTALEFYKKCVETEQKAENNEYLSKSLANIGLIYDEAAEREVAIKYYESSIDADKVLKNYSGLYASSRSLSEIYASKDEKKSLQYLILAYEYAKELNDPYYISDVSLEISNFYLLRKDLKNAYKFLEDAKNSSKLLSKDDDDKIFEKINYLSKYIPSGDNNAK